MDLAVLKMKTKDKFKPVSFGDSSKARVGDWVVVPLVIPLDWEVLKIPLELFQQEIDKLV